MLGVLYTNTSKVVGGASFILFGKLYTNTPYKIKIVIGAAFDLAGPNKILLAKDLTNWRVIFDLCLDKSIFWILFKLATLLILC